MSCIQEPNVEYEKYLKSIRHLTQEDELVLKEKIPWLYNLFHDLPTKRPRFDIMNDLFPNIDTPWNPDELPVFDKFRYNNSSLKPCPKYYSCYDTKSNRSYVTEVQSDGSEKFSRWEPPDFGFTIERWFPGIKKYVI